MAISSLKGIRNNYKGYYKNSIKRQKIQVFKEE